MRRSAASILAISLRWRSRARNSIARSVSDDARSARSGWFWLSSWRCCSVSLASLRMSSRQSSSFRRKYSRWRSFMKGSLSEGRYSRSIGSRLLPFPAFLSSALPFLLLSNCMSLLRTHDWCEVLPARLAYISMVGDRDNKDDEIPGRHCMAAPGAPRTTLPYSYLLNEFNSLRSDHTGFGELDRNAQVDLGQHGIELFIAGTVLEIGGDGLQPQQRTLIQRPRQQAELELVERVQRAAAVLDRAPAPFRRLLYTLQRNERVDAAERPQRHRRALRLGWLGIGQGEGAAGGATRRGWCRRNGGPVGSIDAHDIRRCALMVNGR